MSLTAALTDLGCTVEEQVSYASMGYWRIGGPIRRAVTVHTTEQLQSVFQLAQASDEPVLVLGNGSNMLMSDDGLEGIGIILAGDFESIEFDDEGVTVGAGVKNVRALSQCKRQGRGGLGSLAGVPGTIGGAIRMNAGTYLGEIETWSIGWSGSIQMRIPSIETRVLISILRTERWGCHGAQWS